MTKNHKLRYFRDYFRRLVARNMRENIVIATAPLVTRGNKSHSQAAACDNFCKIKAVDTTTTPDAIEISPPKNRHLATLIVEIGIRNRLIIKSVIS